MWQIAQPGDEGLVVDAMLAAETHGAHAAASEGVQQFLAPGLRIAEAAVAAGADDRGVPAGPAVLPFLIQETKV